MFQDRWRKWNAKKKDSQKAALFVLCKCENQDQQLGMDETQSDDGGCMCVCLTIYEACKIQTYPIDVNANAKLLKGSPV